MMSEEKHAYPRPIVDLDNRPMLEAWENGRLLLQQCRSCDATYFYPRVMCPFCWSRDLDWREAEGNGHIVSYSLIYRPNHPSFDADVPIILAEITLSEGATMLARIICDKPEVVRTGAGVRLIQEPKEVARLPLPAFRLA